LSWRQIGVGFAQCCELTQSTQLAKISLQTCPISSHALSSLRVHSTQTLGSCSDKLQAVRPGSLVHSDDELHSTHLNPLQIGCFSSSEQSGDSVHSTQNPYCVAQ